MAEAEKKDELDIEDILAGVGEDDAPVAFSAELLDQVLGFDNVRLAMMSTYSSAVAKFKLGN